jgi:hypothetical protein
MTYPTTAVGREFAGLCVPNTGIDYGVLLANRPLKNSNTPL